MTLRCRHEERRGKDQILGCQNLSTGLPGLNSEDATENVNSELQHLFHCKRSLASNPTQDSCIGVFQPSPKLAALFLTGAKNRGLLERNVWKEQEEWEKKSCVCQAGWRGSKRTSQGQHNEGTVVSGQEYLKINREKDEESWHVAKDQALHIHISS